MNQGDDRNNLVPGLPLYDHLGPGGIDYFTPNFWVGRSSETVGRRGPRTSPKVSPIIRGMCQKLKSNPPKKFALDPPSLKVIFCQGN